MRILELSPVKINGTPLALYNYKDEILMKRFICLKVNLVKENKEGNMISLLIWLILGFLAGFLAKAIMPGPDGGGIILTTILGIVGAVVGGFIGTLFGFEMVSSFDNIGGSLPTFIFAVIGAIAVLAIYRLIVGREVA